MSLIDFSNFARSSKPNSFLIAPEGVAAHAKPDEPSPRFGVDADILYQRVLAMISDHPRWRLEECDDAARQVHFVAVTPLLRFKDDIDIQVFPMAGDPTASCLAIFSRSRVGYSDLGANASRVSIIVELLGADE